MEGAGDEKNGVCPQTEGGAGWLMGGAGDSEKWGSVPKAGGVGAGGLMGGAGAREKWGLSPQPEAVPVGRWEALIKKWGRAPVS